MPTYITLLKLTDQGIKNIKGSPRRIEEGMKCCESIGGKMIGFYSVLGEYDYVSICEVPNDEAILLFNLGLASLGNVRTWTLRAFTTEEFSRMVEKLKQ